MDELIGWSLMASRLPDPMFRRVRAYGPTGSRAYLASLAVSMALYRRWEPGFVDAQDVHDFGEQGMDRATEELVASVREGVASAVKRWSAPHALTEEEERQVSASVLGAARRLGRWLLRHPRPKSAQCRPWIWLSSGGQ